MFKTLALTVAIGAMSALMAVDASALPLAQDKQIIINSDSDITLVREGCGRGMRYSNRLRRCVEEGGVAPIVKEILRPGRCGPGFHYSDRRGRCVRN